MADLSRAWTRKNLNAAWAWLRSNPDYVYKGHFRSLYSAYATADRSLLDSLRDRLVRGVYVPSHATKLFLPKASGILRPYTLLSIEDQIVYQALTNVVAEKLLPHVRSRYNRQTFGHQYAGWISPWFYRKWSDGYKEFNRGITRSFAKGYKWTASFDLTAFYDSIDHNVLRHMLKEIGLDNQFNMALTDYLAQWTATTTKIFHGHGIPQGPLSSGLISEVVLKHFDDQRLSDYDVQYFRYVDDIRLFAKDESHLRHALVRLDRISKDLGLFPQTSKIDIHLVADINREIKTVSNPVDHQFSKASIDQKTLRSRIVAITPRFRVEEPTLFKFLLSRADRSTSLLDRLWRIYDHAPHYYIQIAAHLAKFDIIPERHAERLLQEIERQSHYPAIQSSFIRCSIGRLPISIRKKAKSVLKRLWQPKVAQQDLSDSLWPWLLHEGHYTANQIRYAFAADLPVWLKTRLLLNFNWPSPLTSLNADVLHKSMASTHVDEAIAAAWILSTSGGRLRKARSSTNPLARLILKEHGLMRRAQSGICGIRLAITEMTGKDIEVSWRRLFRSKYKQAEAQIITCKGYYRTDPTAWVNAMDVFNDLLLDALYKIDTKLGTYTLGKIGSTLASNALKASYPAVSNFANQIHNKRHESHLSHPIVKTSKKRTGPIRYSWLKHGSRGLLLVAKELKVALK